METVCAKNHRTFLFLITETAVEGEEVVEETIAEQDDSDPGHGKQSVISSAIGMDVIHSGSNSWSPNLVFNAVKSIFSAFAAIPFNVLITSSEGNGSEP